MGRNRNPNLNETSSRGTGGPCSRLKRLGLIRLLRLAFQFVIIVDRVIDWIRAIAGQD
jgi:hypothetical protein